jgi:hypothetical protein
MTPFYVIAGLVPAIPIRESTALRANEITGTRPVMTTERWIVG